MLIWLFVVTLVFNSLCDISIVWNGEWPKIPKYYFGFLVQEINLETELLNSTNLSMLLVIPDDYLYLVVAKSFLVSVFASVSKPPAVNLQREARNSGDSAEACSTKPKTNENRTHGGMGEEGWKVDWWMNKDNNRYWWHGFGMRWIGLGGVELGTGHQHGAWSQQQLRKVNGWDTQRGVGGGGVDGGEVTGSHYPFSCGTIRQVWAGTGPYGVPHWLLGEKEGTLWRKVARQATINIVYAVVRRRKRGAVV